ncbi:MAG: hypothetical protein RL375_3088 [Pseudomonadota bacterium]|jgi:hypothetical protein
MIAALLSPALALLLLWLLYVVGIQYQRGGWWRFLVLVALPALLLNVILNYTVLALLTWDWPQRGEWTFSKRLERLVLAPGWRGDVAFYVARHLLDPFDPDGYHVKTRSSHG